jgi:hypothetical protein
VADLGVNAVGEIHRRRADRQIDDLALGREDVDLILQHIGFERLNELARISQVAPPLDQAAQPSQLGFE